MRRVVAYASPLRYRSRFRLPPAAPACMRMISPGIHQTKTKTYHTAVTERARVHARIQKGQTGMQSCTCDCSLLHLSTHARRVLRTEDAAGAHRGCVEAHTTEQKKRAGRPWAPSQVRQTRGPRARRPARPGAAGARRAPSTAWPASFLGAAM